MFLQPNYYQSHSNPMLIPSSLLLLPSLLFIIHHLSPTLTLAKPPFVLGLGEWRLLQESIGISAMHMQMLNNNKVVIFDRTDFGASNLSLPNGRCRHNPKDKVLQTDCTAHSVLYDMNSNSFRALFVQTDTWCSSGSVLPNGTLVQTGGFNDGDHAVRMMDPCNDENCDWIEFAQLLSQRRWYASNQILPDGRIIIVGGRAQFNYEFYPRENSKPSTKLKFLRETRDGYENNLYPYLHLLPDGNLFIFANKQSISFDYNQNRVVQEFPPIPGGDSRNYPSSGSSVLLPIDENTTPITPEVMICGGAAHNAFQLAGKGTFLRATNTCGRLKINQSPAWEMEKMPAARLMSDMILLPTGDVIMINGAGSGAAGWELARDPVTFPHIYRPSSVRNERFSAMAASVRPRMYHSTALLLTDGRVLVGGSNPHIYYNFTGVEFPTDLSLESFSPPYLAAEYDALRPSMVRMEAAVIGYNQSFSLTCKVAELVEASLVSVRIMAPPFNTHSSSMNQRMVVLRGNGVSCVSPETYSVAVVGPGAREIAPPGYYVLFVVHADVPSSGMWVQVQ